jgi:pimeloyl-ACP methyl ester carboxylesterase
LKVNFIKRWDPMPDESKRPLLVRAALVIGAATVVVYLTVLASFQLAKQRIIRKLSAGSQVVMTSLGPIEYARQGAGPPVLVVPGSFGGYDQAQAIGRHLGPELSVVAVSRPGYLRTPVDVGRRPDQQADAYRVLLDSLRLDRVAVLALSGGSPSALEFARRHGDRVSALVLIAGLSGPKAQPPSRPSASDQRLDRLFGSGFATWWQTRRLEHSGTAALESPIFSPDTRDRLTKDPAKLGEFFELAWFRFPPALRLPGYLNDREQFGQFSFTDLAGITAPTLVVHGTLDRNAPIEHGDRSATIPGAQYLRIEGGDHYSSIARAEEIWPRVTDFIGRSQPR